MFLNVSQMKFLRYLE